MRVEDEAKEEEDLEEDEDVGGRKETTKKGDKKPKHRPTPLSPALMHQVLTFTFDIVCTVRRHCPRFEALHMHVNMIVHACVRVCDRV